MKFWLDIGIDGFRVDSAAFMYENLDLRDEPQSYINGTTPQDYDYLDHIYTMNLNETYELFGSWHKFIKKYTSKRNLEEKVHEAIFFYLFYNPSIVLCRPLYCIKYL